MGVADDAEPAGGGIPMGYYSDQLCSPRIGTVTENYMQEIKAV